VSCSLLSFSTSEHTGGLGLVKSIDSIDQEFFEPLDPSKDVPLPRLDLSPLSNLTQLYCFQLCPWRDVLPASLLSLDLDTPYGPLLKLSALTQLQELSISNFYHAGVGDLPQLAAKLSGSLHTLRLDLDNPFGVGYCGGEFMPWPHGWLDSCADCFTGEESVFKQ
jgi:hypothetical protein